MPICLFALATSVLWSRFKGWFCFRVCLFILHTCNYLVCVFLLLVLPTHVVTNGKFNLFILLSDISLCLYIISLYFSFIVHFCSLHIVAMVTYAELRNAYILLKILYSEEGYPEVGWLLNVMVSIFLELEKFLIC